jgi:hypothetical protein
MDGNARPTADVIWSYGIASGCTDRRTMTMLASDLSSLAMVVADRALGWPPPATNG